MEDGERWDRALREYVELAIRSRGGEVATIGLAWVLRKLGRADEARKILAPLADGPEPPPFAVFDMASIELERGNSEQAERLLRMMEFDDANGYVHVFPHAHHALPSRKWRPGPAARR